MAAMDYEGAPINDTREEQAWLRTISLVVLAAAVMTVALFYTRAILVPFVLALFLVNLVSPIMDFLTGRLRAPRAVAVGATVLLVIAAIVVSCVIMIVAVQRVVDTAGQYTESFAAMTGRLLAGVRQWGVEVDEQKVLNELRAKMPGMVTASLGTAMNTLSSVVLILIFAMFLLLGRGAQTVRTGVYAEIDAHVRRYISIKVALSVLTGMLVAVILRLLGLELAGVFGLLAFFLNFVPNLGSIAATLLPVPLAVAQYENPWMVVPVIALPGAVQFFIGNVVETKMTGDGLNLHPVAVLLALAFWGLLWGAIGMVLAAPMTAILRIVLLHFETVRPIGELMAGKLPDFGPQSAPETPVAPAKSAASKRKPPAKRRRAPERGE